MKSVLVSWWLDWSALPERELWARLEIEESGKAIVHDCDGKTHSFPSATDARNWLNSDEYSLLENINTEEFIHGIRPPPPA